MKLLETKATLENMLTACSLSKNHREAIKRALIEVELTIDNGDESL